MTFRILTVCTGNVCRSPMAERLLRSGLAQRFGDEAAGVVVGSAGTGALVGEEMTSPTQVLVARHGGEAAGHGARALAEQLVAEADLVLAMTRRHRGDVLRLHPRATRRAFTLREAARLAPLVDRAELQVGSLEDRLRALVPAMAAKRGLVPVDDPDDDDVTDPFRRGDEVYEQMAAQLVPAVDAVLDALGPPGRTPALG
jgi:protein-tyrosine phosphatase